MTNKSTYWRGYANSWGVDATVKGLVRIAERVIDEPMLDADKIAAEFQRQMPEGIPLDMWHLLQDVQRIVSPGAE